MKQEQSLKEKSCSGLEQDHHLFYRDKLYCKTFATATTTAGIRIVEIKPFAVQPITKLQFSIDEVQKAFQISYDLYAFVFKNLIHRFLLIVEIHFVAKSATAAAYNAYP